MTMLYYLLEANLYLLLFYSFYRLFLHQETFYTLNRGYLIVTTIISFLLPFIQAGVLHPVALIDHSTVVSETVSAGNLSTLVPSVPQPERTDYLAYLPNLYAGIAAILLVRLAMGLIRIAKIVKVSKSEKAGAITFVELQNSNEQAFSFFNLLFIRSDLKERETIVAHELAHIKQRHTFDILFFEIVKVVGWFNPVTWLICKDIKLLHEYLADKHTVHDLDKHAYAMFLIENSFGIPSSKITNHIFNQSILKRRINMLNKERSTKRARLRLLLVLPLVLAMVAISTMAFTKKYGMIDIYPLTLKAENQTQQDPSTKTTKPAPKAEKAKWVIPPPIASGDKGAFSRENHYNKTTKKIELRDKRLIIINGKPETRKEFYHVQNADKINYLNATEGAKKYGSDGKFGAVEITGKNLRRYFIPPTQVVPDKNKPGIVAPPPKADVVKFPPPHVVNDPREHVFTKWELDPLSKERVVVEKKLYVINGKPVESLAGIFGYVNAETKKILDPADAQAKYGNMGMYGAVELTGSDIKTVTDIEPPPPRQDKRTALTTNRSPKAKKRFAPPTVRRDSMAAKDQIKFPPPRVINDPPARKRAPAKSAVHKDAVQPADHHVKFPAKPVSPKKVKE